MYGVMLIALHTVRFCRLNCQLFCFFCFLPTMWIECSCLSKINMRPPYEMTPHDKFSTQSFFASINLPLDTTVYVTAFGQSDRIHTHTSTFTHIHTHSHTIHGSIWVALPLVAPTADRTNPISANFVF